MTQRPIFWRVSSLRQSTRATPRELRSLLDSQPQAELRGLNVYDPATDETAGWFIHTDCSQESFLVRHANFIGADKLSTKLQRTVKAAFDEAPRLTPNCTVSRPFDPPSTSRIAVRAIDHCRDKVLMVCPVVGPR